MEWRTTAPMSKQASGRIRLSAEEIYAHELSALAAGDKLARPANWRLSPKAIVTYILGGKAADGTPLANAMLTMAHALDLDMPSFGDSTGELDLNSAPAVVLSDKA